MGTRSPIEYGGTDETKTPYDVPLDDRGRRSSPGEPHAWKYESMSLLELLKSAPQGVPLGCTPDFLIAYAEKNGLGQLSETGDADPAVHRSAPNPANARWGSVKDAHDETGMKTRTIRYHCDKWADRGDATVAVRQPNSGSPYEIDLNGFRDWAERTGKVTAESEQNSAELSHIDQKITERI